MKTQSRWHSGKVWWRAVTRVATLAVLCFASFSYMYGGGSPNVLAHLEGSRLSTVTSTQLFGTTLYNTSVTGASTSPNANPLSQSGWFQPMDAMSMLTGQLMPTSTSIPATEQSQSTLFQSLQVMEQKTHKIVMGWIPNNTTQSTIAMIQENPGLTVASPLWLTLASSKGDITNHVDTKVIQYAHAHHIEVWALVDNQFKSQMSHDVLSNADTRNLVANNLITIAKQDKLDGLNIDFENIASADRAAFSAFMKTLHDEAVPLHIKISVDIAPDISFLKDDAAYFHAQLAAYADYVVLMAYDEHYGGDPTPGPVADVPWVEQSVLDLLDTGVPSDQLIVGIPFYTRFWYVHHDGSVNSEAISDANIQSILTQHQATQHWDNQLGLEYATYSKPDGTEEVWYETDQTMQRKLQIVMDENLAGISIWSLGLSDKTTWTTVVNGLTNLLS